MSWWAKAFGGGDKHEISCDTIQAKINEARAEEQEHRGRMNNDLQAIQSGTRLLRAMGGVMDLASKEKKTDDAK